VAVALVGQYANHLHLAPDRQPHQHLITLQDTLLDAQPIVSKHWRQIQKQRPSACACNGWCEAAAKLNKNVVLIKLTWHPWWRRRRSCQREVLCVSWRSRHDWWVSRHPAWCVRWSPDETCHCSLTETVHTHKQNTLVHSLYSIPTTICHSKPSGSPSNTWFLRPTRVHNPNSISLSSAAFAHSRQRVPTLYNGGRPFSPSKLRLRTEDLEPHLTDGFFRRNRQTDQPKRPCYSICSNRLHLGSAAKKPKNPTTTNCFNTPQPLYGLFSSLYGAREK